jgi:hypothetical protein
VLVLARGLAGTPEQDHRRQHDQHREREMAHDPAVVERAFDREAAEHGLSDDAERQQTADPGQVAPVGAPAQRQQPRQAGRDHDRDRDHPVGELDHRMGVQRRIHVAVALRPCRAAEARAREPHGGACQHDQRQGDQRPQRDDRVLLGRDRVAVRTLTQAVQCWRGHCSP